MDDSDHQQKYSKSSILNAYNFDLLTSRSKTSFIAKGAITQRFAQHDKRALVLKTILLKKIKETVKLEIEIDKAKRKLIELNAMKKKEKVVIQSQYKMQNNRIEEFKETSLLTKQLSHTGDLLYVYDKSLIAVNLHLQRHFENRTSRRSNKSSDFYKPFDKTIKVSESVFKDLSEVPWKLENDSAARKLKRSTLFRKNILITNNLDKNSNILPRELNNGKNCDDTKKNKQSVTAEVHNDVLPNKIIENAEQIENLPIIHVKPARLTNPHIKPRSKSQLHADGDVSVKKKEPTHDTLDIKRSILKTKSMGHQRDVNEAEQHILTKNTNNVKKTNTYRSFKRFPLRMIQFLKSNSGSKEEIYEGQPSPESRKPLRSLATRTSKISSSKYSVTTNLTFNTTKRQNIIKDFALVAREVRSTIKIPMLRNDHRTSLPNVFFFDIGVCANFMTTRIQKEDMPIGNQLCGIRWYIHDTIIKGFVLNYRHGDSTRDGIIHGIPTDCIIEFKWDIDDYLSSIYFCHCNGTLKSVKLFTKKFEVCSVGVDLDDLDFLDKVESHEFPTHCQPTHVISYFTNNDSSLCKLYLAYN